MKRPNTNFLSITAVAALILLANGCSQQSEPAPSSEKEEIVVAKAAEVPQLPEAPKIEEQVDRPDAPSVPSPSPLPKLEPIGEVIFQSGFEEDPIGPAAKLKFHTHPGFRAEKVQLGESDNADTALIIAGSDEPKHSWRPALEFQYGSQSNGRLKISFDVYQASFDAASLNLQVVDMSSGYIVHQRLKMTNDFIQGPGSTDRLFKKTITAGRDAKWHRIEWILPLPGPEKQEMAIRFDGETVREMRHKHRKSGSMNGLRMFLQTRKNADVVYYIDNLLIEKLPVDQN